jgi:hypothetical protein
MPMLALVYVARAAAVVTADGVLNEQEWQSAEVITGFTSVDPFTGEPAPYPAEARVLATDEGLAVSFRTEQPEDTRSHGRSPRDTIRMDADPIRLMVDFEGEGHTAYEFTISSSNSIRDGMLTKGRQAPSYDWDGIWYHGTAHDDRGWSAEWLIPWSSVPTSRGAGERRVVGVWFAQFVKRKSHGYGFPAISSSMPNFIARMHRITVPRYSTARLDLVPYASVISDRLYEHLLGRAGLDFTWKPDGPHQLTATIHPDFGQVESDDLVVNFSAIETFFADKRPFFTEHQGVFDLRLPDEGRLVNTRRIGGNADAGALGASEIIAAAKYTGIVDKFEIGAFAAVEEDSELADGRRYLVGRSNYRGERLSLGWMGTLADRPTLDRTALVQSADFEWTPRDSVSWRGQALASLIDAPDSRDGAGAWLQYRNDPQLRLGQQYELLWFDRNLELNDLGYQPRRSLRQFRGEWDVYQRKHPADSPLAFSRWEFVAKLAQNDFGQDLPAYGKIEREFRFRKPYGMNLRFEYLTSGLDDLITRGGAAVKMPPRHEATLFVITQNSQRVRGEAEFKTLREGVLGRSAIQAGGMMTIIATPAFSTNTQLTWLDSPDWLAFRSRTGELGSYRKKQWTFRQVFNWFPTQRQELRAKLQWVGLQANGRESFTIGAGGALQARGQPAASFHRSELGIQLRYRFEFKPQSEFFAVYTRGGLAGADGERGFAELWSDALDTPNQDQFIVKLRYRF